MLHPAIPEMLRKERSLEELIVRPTGADGPLTLQTLTNLPSLIFSTHTFPFIIYSSFFQIHCSHSKMPLLQWITLPTCRHINNKGSLSARAPPSAWRYPRTFQVMVSFRECRWDVGSSSRDGVVLPRADQHGSIRAAADRAPHGKATGQNRLGKSEDFLTTDPILQKKLIQVALLHSQNNGWSRRVPEGLSLSIPKLPEQYLFITTERSPSFTPSTGADRLHFLSLQFSW